MKKLFLTLFGCAALFALTTTEVKAQNYKTGVGLGLDFGDGATLVGPSLRHHFSRKGAVQAEVLFGGNSTIVQAFLQYNTPIKGAAGLDFYAGGGPSIQLYDGGSSFYIVPMAGLDYKFSGAPLALALDWRPRLYVGSNDSDFNAGRFGLGFRYTF
ncbi:hypothetical protein [Pedobacter jejuensis]|uniref:Outer membrane insertion C-signal n=1 Tax=Pedobacter jejuensis TaxID=1268550 RepID=A0A3N0BYU7_9SPHI|nr:hypothetical protein [Pedobacter jejuensis]RNL54970.1 hypothetical protein D7004_06060 [Pedobacter jejuensis]